MCCGVTETLGWPAEVIEALACYRRLRDQRGWDWGDEQARLFHRPRLASGAVPDEFAESGDWVKAIRAMIGDTAAPGTVVIRVAADGELSADVGPARITIAGRAVPIDVLIDSAVDAELSLTVAGRPVWLPPLGAAVEVIRLDGADPLLTVVLDEKRLDLDSVVRVGAAAKLRLRSARCVRWSVTDACGGAWFPDGVLPKWDFHHRPFFHGHDLTLAVPAEPLQVVCTRGLEYDRTELDVVATAERLLEVECEPQRLFDPAADGWYSGDLHVHMNYSGDLVCSPDDAARMQLGEGLHLVNLVAANWLTSRIYDRDMLEAFAGTDLPWSTGDAVARMGVEYRNDLLGHVHALGPSGPPSRYQSGHERSDHPQDWPPNAVACAELRGLGATVGYCHPAGEAFPDDWSTDLFFARPRSVEARELVADAALGLVDSIDVISPFNHEGAVFLYHRLLSCGIRLAATAGTDVFLSFAHLGTVSNPPGWGRVYGYLGDRALSVEAFQDAIRGGRSVVTNGPWLSIEVNGQGPGAVLDAVTGDRLVIQAQVRGPGADRLALAGPDGVMAEADPAAGLQVELTVDGPTWIAAIARGAKHPNTLDASVLAHTSPVYVEVDGRRVARRADARWCLKFLDSLQRLVHEHGHYNPATRAAHLGDMLAVLEQARTFYRRVAETADR